MNDNAIETYLGLLLSAGCKIQHQTEFFDKSYVWMTDPQGDWFLERLPDVDPKSFSVSDTGEVTLVETER